ncbi:PASTA domain-containing penicillin-binding protein [Kyrpidia tusciae]|uniref:Peptidoglycan glycosyltransferase n=1 Tax=Kyrpidia tusciae (strain DSM 2912 / NBRC 15312 / T2) TaxID=562970 RepID=D5WQF4_KYRT2|nr:PASTA domain-containing penicillin-binding protein [Kyrpidia tusciae]ADG06563.1 Peptidoglycan glycosyltransferase [Kyrpidia tusciae DSM 2912]
MRRGRRRHVWLLGGLVATLAAVTLRLGWIQVVNTPAWAAQAENVWVANEDLPAKRGEILDRNGRVLAETVPAYNVVLHTKAGQFPDIPVIDESGVAKLAPLVHMTPDQIDQVVSAAGEWTELRPGGMRLDEDVAQKIRSLKLPGVFLTDTTKRVYPGGSLAAHVLGFTNVDTGEGQAGVELEYNNILKGQSGHARYLKDRNGYPLPFGKEQIDPPVDGKNVVLTIDSAIQAIVERELDRLMADAHPQTASVIVADPRTGEILAMANRPTFDPNQYWKSSSSVLDRNIAISDPFEPGSTFKLVTLTAALAEHKVNLNDTFQSGKIVVQGVPIHDWNWTGFGTISFRQAVIVSSNVGFVILGQRVGAEKLYQYIDQFGFHSKTGIDLPGESGAQLFDPATIRPIDLATTAFGQGIAVTPIQQVEEVTAIANGGKLVRPHVLKEVVDPKTGAVLQKQGTEVIRDGVAPPDVLNTVRQIMEDVVSKDTSKAAYIPGYHVAGKTGTAQIPLPNHTGYYPDRYRTSFIGFAPENDPRVLIYVTAEAPKVALQFGNTVASPVAKRILEQVLPYLGVAPDPKDLAANPPKGAPNPAPPAPQNLVTVPSVQEKDSGQAQQILRAAGLKAWLTGKPGPVAHQWPAPGVQVAKGAAVVLQTPARDDGKVAVPDFTGLTMRDAADLCAAVGLKLSPTGDGWAISQSVPADGLVPAGSTVQVTFDSRSPGS